MRNKILCWAWGHQFEKWFSYELVTGFLGEYRKYESTYYKCKHCGARK